MQAASPDYFTLAAGSATVCRWQRAYWLSTPPPFARPRASRGAAEQFGPLRAHAGCGLLLFFRTARFGKAMPMDRLQQDVLGLGSWLLLLVDGGSRQVMR